MPNIGSFIVDSVLSLPKMIGDYLSYILKLNIECHSKDTWEEMLKCTTGPKRLEVLPFELTLGIITIIVLLPEDVKENVINRVKTLVKGLFEPLLTSTKEPVLKPYELTELEQKMFGEDIAPE